MAYIIVYRTRYPTAERMLDILKPAGIDVEIDQMEPGRQNVFCKRGLEEIVAEVVDPKQCENLEFPYEAFCFSAPTSVSAGYLVMPSRPGWLFFCFTLPIVSLLQESGFLLDATTPPPRLASCPQCGKNLRSSKAEQCFYCGADWHVKIEPAM
jgi:hypothetical protein